jgi:hypothetical protein
MKKTLVQKSGHQLWGIYHTDHEHVRALSDPLRTTIEAPTKIAAEEAAAKLGFSDPRAHLIAPEVVKSTERILKRRPGHQQALTKTSSSIHI